MHELFDGKPEGLSEYLPQSVPVIWIRYYPPKESNFKIVWRSPWKYEYIVCRTDVQPLMWLWWWIYFRVIETLHLAGLFILHVLQAWDLYEAKENEFMTWRSLFEQWKQRLIAK